MNPHLSKSVTLIELVIAVSIFALIVVGFSNIDTFSRYQVMSSDRRATLQNDAAYVLEHMAKEIGKAIGDFNYNPVTIEDSNKRIRVYMDANNDGQRNDQEIAYQYDSANYRIQYYNPYPSGTPETVSKKISACVFNHTWNGTKENFVKVDITTCWDPDGSPLACGNPDNPALSMKNRISMPAVSTR